MKDESPILLQGNCEVFFQVRADGIPGEIKGPDLQSVTDPARSLLPRGRVWIDLHLSYVGRAGNEQARGSIGRASKRLASWEVFETDLILCPAGRAKLDPKWYEIAATVTAGEAVA